MQIFVKMPGISSYTALEVDSAYTIRDVKAEMADRTEVVAVNSDLYYFTFGRKVLDDGHMLSHYNIRKDSTLIASLRSTTGMTNTSQG